MITAAVLDTDSDIGVVVSHPIDDPELGYADDEGCDGPQGDDDGGLASTNEGGGEVEVDCGGEEEEKDKAQGRRSCLLKIGLGLVLVGIIAYIIADSLTTQNVKNGIVSFLDWIQDNPGEGVVLFILGKSSAVVLSVRCL